MLLHRPRGPGAGPEQAAHLFPASLTGQLPEVSSLEGID